MPSCGCGGVFHKEGCPAYGVVPAGWDQVRLCVDTHHPIDSGNYDGPVHCTAHPEGHACVTALYARRPNTTVTDEERHRGFGRTDA